jgi:hypothetical protein
MPTFFNYIWIIFIGVTIINGMIWRTRSQEYIAKNPDVKNGYDSLIKGWFIYANIPWLIMGAGMLTG